MNEQQKRPCNPEDVVCQMEVLRHLKGLREQMGNEAFLEKYPEGAALQEKLSPAIVQQEQVVQEKLAECSEESEPAAEPETPEEPAGEAEEESEEDA